MIDSQPTTRRSFVESVNPLLTGPKRQHFLPKFYLEGFCVNGMLAVYDRDSNEVRVQSPLNTAVIGHFYTFTDSEGQKRYELEQMLAKVEGKASPAIVKLAAKEQLSGEERADLAIFIALAVCRTPDMVESVQQLTAGLISDIAKSMFSNTEQTKAIVRDKFGVTTSEQELEVEAGAITKFVQDGDYEVKTNHTWAVGVSVAMALEIAPVLVGRDWLVVHRQNEKKSFVTSDAPVILSTVKPRKPSMFGIGFCGHDAMVVFSLTQSCALIISGKNGALGHRDVNEETIRNINLNIANGFQRFVIGRDDTLVESLARKLDLGSKKWRPKMQRIF
jgi:hypothetical protein